MTDQWPPPPIKRSQGLASQSGYSTHRATESAIYSVGAVLMEGIEDLLDELRTLRAMLAPVEDRDEGEPR